MAFGLSSGLTKASLLILQKTSMAENTHVLAENSLHLKIFCKVYTKFATILFSPGVRSVKSGLLEYV